MAEVRWTKSQSKCGIPRGTIVDGEFVGCMWH